MDKTGSTSDIYAGFSHISDGETVLSICLAPARSFFISTPAIADGKRPTAEKTEYLPPTLGGTGRLLKHSSAAIFLNGPFTGSVVITIWFLYFLPSLFLSRSLITRNCATVSAVPPDFVITLNTVFLRFKIFRRGLKLSGSILSQKKTLRPFLLSLGRRL